MTVTFFDPESVVLHSQYPCVCTDLSHAPATGCRDCGGTGVASFERFEREVQMANDNARAILAILDPGTEPEFSGCWEFEQLPAVQQRLLLAINQDHRRAPFVTEGYESATVISSARTDEYLLYKLRALQALVTAAQACGHRVCWG